jgi:hypothetical protein
VAIVSTEGFARPFDADGQPYASFGGLTPTLRSFYLGYTVGSGAPRDHQILDLGVMAGGVSQDLTPSVNFQPANIPDGRIRVELQDSNPSGEEFFYKVSHSVFGANFRRYQMRAVGNVGEITSRLPESVLQAPGLPNPLEGKPVLALVGFRLFFGLSGDHEIERIGIWFDDDGDLHVVFRDHNAAPQEDYSYLVDFVVIPRTSLMNFSTKTERGSAEGGQRIPIRVPQGSHIFLTGWLFDFQNGDHNIRELGVDVQGNDLVVFFADRNADDPFDWRVDWAAVGPQLETLG